MGARVGYVEPGTQHYVFDPQETGAFLGKRGDTVQLEVTATYSDGTVLRTWKDQEIPGLEWWVDYSEWASVDRDTGLLTVLGEGSTTVCASAPAGDGDSISSRFYVVCEKSGRPDGILAPSATLAVHVMCDGNGGVDEELFSRIYSASDVASLCEERWIGLQMQAPGLFKTIVSEGIPVCSLVEEQGVDLQDVVRYYAFIPGRGVIPYAVERLNEDGFYFPNADIGFAAEAQRAPAVLSYASHETLNSLVPYEGGLDASYRFHLVVASRALNDYISDQLASGISDFYIVVGRDCDL